MVRVFSQFHLPLMRNLLPILITLAVFILGGCPATSHYKSIKTGRLKEGGKFTVEWKKPNKFLYVPDKEHPITFTRSDKSEIVLIESFYTDGGSIPRAFWALKNYSPWGYAPAFIIHDWLFRMQNCQKPGWEKYSIKDAALIMSEVMKTMMESPDFNYGDETTVYLMYLAVQTEPAQTAWKNRECKALDAAGDTWRPDVIFEIEIGGNPL